MWVAEEGTLRICAVDLFCGAGGLTRGLLDAGIEVVAGYDLDPYCEYPYTRNQDVKFSLADVRDVTGDDVRSRYPEGTISVLAGCAPCQPFSTYTQGTNPRNSDKWGLIQQFGRIIRESKPDIVSMENVPRLQKQDIFRDFLYSLRREGYHVDHSIVPCLSYGVPQTRNRLVLLGSKFGPIRLIPPTHLVNEVSSLRDVIGHLEPLEAGQASSTDTLHRSSALSTKNLQRIRSSRAGGTWKDWDEALRTDCHRTPAGSKYLAVYGRMRWDRPSGTITTHFNGFGSGRFGHPEQDRALSLREAALLQTFPKDYDFIDPEKPILMNTYARLIGNAVPVRLGYVIGLSILKHLRTHRSVEGSCRAMKPSLDVSRPTETQA